MDIYMYATADTPPSAAAQNFIDITDMYRMGFLNSESSVWINANVPEAGMWVLTDRSTFLKVYRPVYAGWIRLTRSSSRWAKTLNGTSQNGTPVLDLRDLPTTGGDSPNATIIVAHRDPDNTVGVVADGSIQRPDKFGQVKFDPFTVIDLNKYTAPEVDKARSAYNAAHAMINGASVMSVNVPDGGEFIRDNMDAFKVEFDEQHLDYLQKRWSEIEVYAQTQSERLIRRLKKLGLDGGWSDGDL